jgi:hypothetical protein
MRRKAQIRAGGHVPPGAVVVRCRSTCPACMDSTPARSASIQRSPVRPATRWMRVGSRASTRRIAGRIVVSRRASLDVPPQVDRGGAHDGQNACIRFTFASTIGDICDHDGAGPPPRVYCANGQLHRSTSSAWKRMCRGIVSPRTWAVLRLMTSSNLVGCSTGRSAGLAPLRSLST